MHRHETQLNAILGAETEVGLVLVDMVHALRDGRKDEAAKLEREMEGYLLTIRKAANRIALASCEVEEVRGAGLQIGCVR